MLAALLLAAAPLSAQGDRPPITPQTARSGGALDPDQAKLRLDTVDLAIEVFPARQQIAGVASLTFTAKAPVTLLPIDLDRNLPVSAISINGTPLPRSAWRNPDGRLFVTLPRAAAAAAGGTLTARISYGGSPRVAVRAPWDGGFVWAKTPAGQPWIATAVQGEGCDLFWPCIDSPTFEPARMDLHITVPKGLKAPSNGVLRTVDALPDGRTIWHWSVARPNTYAIALNIGPYEELTGRYRSRFGNTIPLHYWYLPGDKAKAERLFAEFAPTLDFFERVIGPYPFAAEKVGVVNTPHLGMEHQTINAYGNAYKQAAEGFDWLFQHEFAHEWFANQLTAADWDDFWLHEGYGAYMQPLYGQWREGDARYLAMLMKQRETIANKAPIVSGTPRAEEDVYDEDKGGPGGDIYVKGSWVLHTLRGLIGDRAFFEVTRRAVYGRPDPRPGNFAPRFSSTREYRALVNQVTSKDYGWFFDVYLSRAALPDLVETRRGTTLSLAWVAPDDLPFPMPVEVEVDGVRRTIAMTNGRGTLSVPAEAHVVIDPAARILRRSRAIESVQAQAAAAAAARSRQ
ncbi:Peptidase family M1 [Sphingomonas guangdongensis]|uniref:Aminopeptidase N n=1 Tax=Sphingomonas guangdongensis TaxID=1141890 RepID=A0A285QY85_9SPHN|nr:M1 family metallopeptidase [Sphingomonas guangdongensis]SOB86935.1 Peptidase family M1 [Sphingomonas guangdongensis]